MAKKSNLTIEFDNQEALKHFALWLCESGEQAYWDWMREVEYQEDGNVSATSFSYHGIEDESKSIDDPTRYGTFMCDNIIRTKCGRLDGEE
jgi:hypothetical protein